MELDPHDPDAGAMPPALPAPLPSRIEHEVTLEQIQIATADALERIARAREIQSSRFVARQQTVLLLIVSGVVVALVALGLQPYVAVSTAFAAGCAAIELQRRGRGRPSS